MPDIVEIFKCSGAILYSNSLNGTYMYSYYDGKFEKKFVDANDPMFYAAERENYNNYFCYQSAIIENQNYTLFLITDKEYDENNLNDINIYNIIHLFLENSLLKEQIVYESEHDKMTGLFNKGKCISMLGNNFGNPKNIAIFNMDVNNLKHMNDTYGHEMGDKLIIKASESLKAVQSDNVMGFRIGGDEVMLVAVNINEETAYQLKAKWEKEVEKLNKRNDSISLVIACGMSFGKENYDINALLDDADKLMYKDKQLKKSFV